MTLAQPHLWVCTAGAGDAAVVCGRWAPAPARDQARPAEALMAAAAGGAAGPDQCARCAPPRRAWPPAKPALRRGAAPMTAAAPSPPPRRGCAAPGVLRAEAALQPDTLAPSRLPAQWHHYHAKRAEGPRPSRLGATAPGPQTAPRPPAAHAAPPAACGRNAAAAGAWRVGAARA
jgi:hypothetical protein